MRNFIIVNKAKTNHPLASLQYDPTNKTFFMRIEPTARAQELQGMMRVFYDQGMLEPGEKWSMRWVRERIIPQERQGLGIILRKNGLSCYEEISFLEKSMGLSVQDDMMVLEVSSPSIITPDRIRNIRKKHSLSQRKFAEIMGISQKTVESWETGRNTPSGMAKKLLIAIDKDPSLLKKLSDAD